MRRHDDTQNAKTQNALAQLLHVCERNLYISHVPCVRACKVPGGVTASPPFYIHIEAGKSPCIMSFRCLDPRAAEQAL
jgi:hypothetical protein